MKGNGQIHVDREHRPEAAVCMCRNCVCERWKELGGGSVECKKYYLGSDYLAMLQNGVALDTNKINGCCVDKCLVPWYENVLDATPIFCTYCSSAMIVKESIFLHWPWCDSCRSAWSHRGCTCNYTHYYILRCSGCGLRCQSCGDKHQFKNWKDDRFCEECFTLLHSGPNPSDEKTIYLASEGKWVVDKCFLTCCSCSASGWFRDRVADYRCANCPINDNRFTWEYSSPIYHPKWSRKEIITRCDACGGESKVCIIHRHKDYDYDSILDSHFQKIEGLYFCENCDPSDSIKEYKFSPSVKKGWHQIKCVRKCEVCGAAKMVYNMTGHYRCSNCNPSNDTTYYEYNLSKDQWEVIDWFTFSSCPYCDVPVATGHKGLIYHPCNPSTYSMRYVLYFQFAPYGDGSVWKLYRVVSFSGKRHAHKTVHFKPEDACQCNSCVVKSLPIVCSKCTKRFNPERFDWKKRTGMCASCQR